jgi:hypothetical protein
MSVSHYLHDFIAHRLEHVTMYNADTSADNYVGLIIVFYTLALLHEAISPNGAVAEKDEAANETTKSDKTSTQADKAAKLATDNSKTVSDLQKDVKKLKDKVF